MKNREREVPPCHTLCMPKKKQQCEIVFSFLLVATDFLFKRNLVLTKTLSLPTMVTFVKGMCDNDTFQATVRQGRDSFIELCYKVLLR